MGRDDLILLPLLVFWRWLVVVVLLEVIVAAIREGGDSEEVNVASRGLRRLLLVGFVLMICCFCFNSAILRM